MNMTLWMMVVWSVWLSGIGMEFSPCRMKPLRTVIHMPSQGLHWLPGEPTEGACEDVPDALWVRHRFGGGELLFHAEGPSGSGRYWRVTVGMANSVDAAPIRGFCFTTSTMGWRTLQHYPTLPLPWIADRDGDDVPELIVWESFPLVDEPSAAEFGLTAWVYRIEDDGTFRVDLDLSRTLAGEIASAYAQTPDRASPEFHGLRAAAKDALRAFAEGDCSP